MDVVNIGKVTHIERLALDRRYYLGWPPAGQAKRNCDGRRIDVTAAPVRYSINELDFGGFDKVAHCDMTERAYENKGPAKTPYSASTCSATSWRAGFTIAAPSTPLPATSIYAWVVDMSECPSSRCNSGTEPPCSIINVAYV